ncbi:MAG: DUF1150 domain-containing protein [Alphaproteobacteria bacterium]|nr:DUF1150 domain-containing protein [Alphaproteobacteria bacterium]
MTTTDNLPPNTQSYLRGLSVHDFMALGMKQIAYVKPVALDDRVAFVVHAADGTPLSVHDDAPAAFLTARHNDLQPVTLQ